MRLLDAVEQFGYGNWKDISGFIETKTPEQASLFSLFGLIKIDLESIKDHKMIFRSKKGTLCGGQS